MPTTDPRVDAYINAAKPFAQPILISLRAQIHAACPEVTESIKWRFPNFDYHGKVLCGIAGFKAHCALGLWKREGTASHNRFSQLTSVGDLPKKKELAAMLHQAMAVIDSGVKQPRVVKAKRPAPKKPKEFIAALKAKPAVGKQFNALPPSHRREYLEWIAEAKRPETRAMRIATTLEKVASGKSLNAKYER